MDLKSTNNRLVFLWPFTGFGYFLLRPSLWWLPLISVLILSFALVAIFIVLLIVLWPAEAVSFTHKMWLILKDLGLSSAGVLVGFISLMPLIITIALDKLVRKVLIIENGGVVNVTFFNSIYSSTVIFFKTFFWRVFWPIVGIIAAIFMGPVGIFISQLGIGHLAAIDAVDLVLALKGNSTKKRLEYYRNMKGEIFCFGFFSAILSMVLSVTIIGWLLWIPAIFCGATLWVKDWPELKREKNER